MKRIITILSFVLLYSCSDKISVSEYVQEFKRSTLVKKEERDSFIYELSYLPAKLIALKEHPKNDQELEVLIADKKDLDHYQLIITDKFPHSKKSIKPDQMYYLTEFQKEISVNQDSVLTYYHVEANNFQDRKVIFFGVNRQDSNSTVIINKHHFDKHIFFKFERPIINQFENFKINL